MTFTKGTYYSQAKSLSEGWATAPALPSQQAAEQQVISAAVHAVDLHLRGAPVNSTDFYLQQSLVI